MLQRQLNLTADQTTQVKALLEDGRAKMEALHTNTALSDQDKHAQGMALHQEEHDKLMALLTPEQKTKFAEMEQRMRERRQGGGGGAEPPPPPPPPGV
jgi:Spy/CpxP family protein refolding chaperone